MSLKGLQTNRYGNRNLIMKKMSNTLIINIFAWSILGGLLHACQIVIHFDVLLFFRIMMHCFGPWFLWIYEEMQRGPLHFLINPQKLCLEDERFGGRKIWRTKDLEDERFGGRKIVFGGRKMHLYCTLMHACQDIQPRNE